MPRLEPRDHRISVADAVTHIRRHRASGAEQRVLLGSVLDVVMLRQTLHQEKESAIRQIVDSGYGVLVHYQKLEQNGSLSRAAAQAAAMGTIKGMRYNGEEYFWITDDQELHASTHAHIEGLVLEWFPMLHGVRFTHHWGGSVGMPRDWMPMVAFDPATRIATARGYTGQGVSTANLTARVLAELIAGRRTELSQLPVAERRSPLWEVEPLRWLAVRYMQNAFRRIDEAGKRGKPMPLDAPLAKYIGRH